MASREELQAKVIEELRKRQTYGRSQYVDPSSAGGIPELDKIRTAEQAKRARNEVDAPLESGPAHMELAKDILWPVDALASVAGPVAKGMKSAGNMARGASNIATRPFGVAAERQAAIDLVKDPAKLEPHARGLIEGAAEKMSGRIGEQEKTLQELIKGRKGMINPDRVSEVMPQYGAKLSERRTAPTTQSIPTGTQYYDEVNQPSLGMQVVNRTERDIPNTNTKFNELMTQEQLGMSQGVPGHQPQVQLRKGQLDLFETPSQKSMPFDEMSLQPGPSRSRPVEMESPSQQFDWQEQYGLPLKQVDETRVAADAPTQFGQLPTQEQYGLPLTQTTNKKVSQGSVPVDLESLLRVKRVGDKMKNYSFTDAMNPNTVAKAKQASNVSDIARQQIYQNAPGSEEVLGAMGKDIRLKNYLTGKGGKNPISAMQASPGTLKSSVLAQIDQAAGTNLAKEGDKIRTASKSLIDPGNLVRPLKAPSELWKIGGRATTKLGSGIQSGLDAASNVINKVPGTSGLLDRSAFSGMRDALQGPMTPEAKPMLQVNTDLNQQGPGKPTREETIRQIQEELNRRRGR